MFYNNKSALLTLYQNMASVYPGNDIDSQGGKQFFSNMRYFLALDEFIHIQNKQFDTLNRDQKELYFQYVGNIVKLSDLDNGKNLYTMDFSKTIKADKDYGVGSNFLSVNAVAKSRSSEENIAYPGRYSTLIICNHGILTIPEDAYSNFWTDEAYLGGSIDRSAKLLLWICRYLPRQKDQFEREELLNAVRIHYSDTLISALKWDDPDLLAIVAKLDNALSKTTSPCFLERNDFPSTDDQKWQEILEYLNNIDDDEKIKELKKLAKEKRLTRSSVCKKPCLRILFGAPGTGKSHKLEEDCKTYFCDSNEILENHLIEEIKNRPQDKDKEPWFNHIGMKYASFVYKIVNENTEEALQGRLGISQNELWKMKTAAKASIDYAHVINNGVEEIGKRYERVTFHPNYSYAQFVGTYKPVQNSEKGKESEILYSYVPGPFLRILVNALKHPEQDFLLIIEEINRANVAAVFGDVFQLLDRKDGVSEYPVAASKDIRRYLEEECDISDCNELKIPSNMYIWATMNSADQGVFPMDTAFKRRWEFEYIDIDHGNEQIQDLLIPMQDENVGSTYAGTYFVKWNSLRTEINKRLSNLGINEDKLMGPFFVSKDSMETLNRWLSKVNKKDGDAGTAELDKPICYVLDDGQRKSIDMFRDSFCSKVLMYLFEDAARMHRKDLFKGDEQGSALRYSNVCKKFLEAGLGVFNFDSAKEDA